MEGIINDLRHSYTSNKLDIVGDKVYFAGLPVTKLRRAETLFKNKTGWDVFSKERSLIIKKTAQAPSTPSQLNGITVFTSYP